MKRPPIQIPETTDRVLLHTCCAPCSSAIIEWMMQNGITPTLYYYNPNIYPEREYEVRKQECMRHAKALGLQQVDAEYNHADWKCGIKGLEKEPERGLRCLECFKIRLLHAARYAQENGYKVLTTTLASSRWKSLEQINEAGEWACAQTGVVWWGQNWRAGGLQERRNTLLKENNFYNQTYCGCEFSIRPESENTTL